MSDTKQKSGYLTWLLLGIALVAFVVAHFCGQQTKIERPKSMGDKEYSVLPNPNALVWMSMGQQEFVADLIWIRALQYNNIKNEAHLAENFADAMIALDPQFKAVYKWASVASVFSDNITPQSVEKANYYLALGAKQFPLDPYYDYSIALNNISYYPKTTEEKDKQLRSDAIAHLQLAMQKPGAEPNISLLISGLLNNDDVSAKIKFLQQAVLTEDDPETKRHLQTRLVLLSESTEDSFLILSAKRDQFHRDHHPYLPIMLDYMLGTP
jgi:hypothetical protein